MVLTDLEKGAFWQLIGMTCHDISPGKSEIKLPLDERVKNIYDGVHGGAIAAIIDSAIGTAVKSCLQPGRRANTLELNVHFIASASEGVLTASGEMIHKGKTTMVGRCEVRDGKLRLIAYGTAVFLILDGTY